MTCEWEVAKLGDLCQLRAGSVFKPSLQGRSTGDIPFVKVSDMNLPANGMRLQEANNWILEDDLLTLRAKPLPPGTVVFAKIGEALRQNRLRQVTRRTVIDNNMMGAVPFVDRVDSHFLYYALSQFDFSEIAQGTALPYLTISSLSGLSLSLPPLSEQHAIVQVLKALDDKIELNRRMSETLEQTAKTLFREWFVSPPDEPEMRQAWEVKPLDEIADFLNGAVSQRYPPVEGEASLPVIKIRELNQGITEQSGRVTAAIPKKWHVEDGDVLFSWSGTLVAKKWTGGRAALNQHLFKVSSSTYPQWFFFQWILHHLDAFRGIAADKATTMGHIRRRHLSEAKCLIPDPATLKAMSNIMQPLHRRRLMCDLESRTLAELRDTLLPKLISGELRVPQAEQLVSEVV